MFLVTTKLKNFGAGRPVEIGAWEERHHVFIALVQRLRLPILMKFCDYLRGMGEGAAGAVVVKSQEPDRDVTEHQAMYGRRAALAVTAGVPAKSYTST